MSLTVSAAKSGPAREHLVEDDAEGPDVGPLVDGAASRLFRRHVRGGAEDDAELRAVGGRHRGRVHDGGGAGQVGGGRSTRRIHRLGEAEVEDFDLSVDGGLDVLRLEVAVDDSLVVRLFQRLGDLSGDGEALLERQGSRGEPFGQRRSLDELHDEGADAARLFEAEDGGDVRVVQLGQQLRLALEAGEALLVLGEGGGEDLDGDLALQLRVGGAKDLAHAALAELAGNLVGAEASARGEGRHLRPLTT